MVWIVTGAAAGVAFSVAGRAQRSLHGAAVQHDPIQAVDDFDRYMDQQFQYDETFYARVRDCQCNWSIRANNAPKHELALYGNELLKRVKENPDTAHCRIGMHRNPDVLGVALSLPSEMLQQVWELFAMAATVDRFEYVISLEFVGFRYSHVDVPVPTIEEFEGGAAYLSTVTSITVRPADA